MIAQHVAPQGFSSSHSFRNRSQSLWSDAAELCDRSSLSWNDNLTISIAVVANVVLQLLFVYIISCPGLGHPPDAAVRDSNGQFFYFVQYH